MKEGDKLVVTSECRRHECVVCGEEAVKKHTYLLPNARRNPQSSGYGKDDISRCADTEEFTCEKCMYPIVMGYEWCGTYSFGRQYEHMFLYWKETGREEFQCMRPYKKDYFQP